MTKLTLGVYRRRDDRSRGEDEQSPLGFELHNRRKAALHAVFDPDPDFKVENWGCTDDTQRSHEFVELTLAFAVSAFHYAVVPGLIWLGTKLVDKGVDAMLSEAAKALVAKLRGAQEAKSLCEIVISMPNGTLITVQPPDRGATICISFKEGKPLEEIKERYMVVISFLLTPVQITLKLTKGGIEDEWEQVNGDDECLFASSGFVNSGSPDRLVCVTGTAGPKVAVVTLEGANWDTAVDDTGSAILDQNYTNCSSQQTWTRVA